MADVVSLSNVESKGVGKTDYSKVVEYASQPTLKGNLVKNMIAYSYYGLAALPTGDYYTIHLPIRGADGKWYTQATSNPEHVFKAWASASADCMIHILLAKYPDYNTYLADIAADEIARYTSILGSIYNYKHAEIIWTNGVKTEEGRTYAIFVGVWGGGQDAFDVHLGTMKLLEAVVL